MIPTWFLPDAVMPRDAVNPHIAPEPVSGPLMSPDALPDPERGCIIGVIDDAIPFAHQRLRLPGGLSRVASLWVQDARVDPTGPGQDLPWGVELRGDRISGWLADLESGAMASEDTIYRLSGVVDMNRRTTHSAAFASGHGAAVALLAAGYRCDNPNARDHPLIGVNLAPGVIADASGTLAADALLSAIIFVITRARLLCRQIEASRDLPRNSVRLPVVLNLSMGLTAGPRDGDGTIERFLDLVAGHQADDLGQVHVVLPTGNHRMARMRATLRPGAKLGWQLPPDDATLTPLEVWGPVLSAPPATPMQIGLTPPGASQAQTTFDASDQSSNLCDADGRDMASAFYRVMPSPGGWRECITLIIAPTCPETTKRNWATPGRWQLQLVHGAEGDYAVSVQRDDVLRGFPREARQSWLLDPAYHDRDKSGFPILFDPVDHRPAKVQRADTVNAYATGQRSLRAGSVSRMGQTVPYASLIGPDQGGDVLVRVDWSPWLLGMTVRGRSSGAFGIMSGSSMAAPQAARWLAGQLANGKRPANRAAIRALAGGQPAGPSPVLPDTENRWPD